VRPAKAGKFRKGESPSKGKNLSPLAWVAGWRVTNILKPTDKAILGMVSESSGRNENERVGGLVKPKFNGRAFYIEVNAASGFETEIDTNPLIDGVLATAW